MSFRNVSARFASAKTTRLAYASEEAAEGRDAFLEKRRPDWTPFPYFY